MTTFKQFLTEIRGIPYRNFFRSLEYVNRPPDYVRDNPEDYTDSPEDIKLVSRMEDDALSLRKILKRHGFRHVGEGSWGSVFTSPTYPYALKFYSASDEAYDAWVRFCIKRPHNQLCPKFRGTPIPLTTKVGAANKIKVVRLEKLRAVTDRTKLLELTNFLQSSVHEPNVEYPASATGWSYKDALELVPFLKALRNSEDLHDENVMIRSNGRLVVIDPGAGPLHRRQMLEILDIIDSI